MPTKPLKKLEQEREALRGRVSELTKKIAALRAEEAAERRAKKAATRPGVPLEHYRELEHRVKVLRGLYAAVMRHQDATWAEIGGKLGLSKGHVSGLVQNVQSMALRARSDSSKNLNIETRKELKTMGDLASTVVTQHFIYKRHDDNAMAELKQSTIRAGKILTKFYL